MSIVDAFNIYNLDHLEAWEELCEVGIWPDDFIYDLGNSVGASISFPPLWQVTITSKMADAWYHYKLS